MTLLDIKFQGGLISKNDYLLGQLEVLKSKQQQPEITPHMATVAAFFASKKAPWHHLWTDKNLKAEPQWTVEFEAFLQQVCGLSLKDLGDLNLMQIPGHEGPHPPPYHLWVAGVLRDALEGKRKIKNTQQCLDLLQEASDYIKSVLAQNPELLGEDGWLSVMPNLPNGAPSLSQPSQQTKANTKP